MCMSEPAHSVPAVESPSAPSSVDDVLTSLLGSTMSRGEGATATLEAARYHLASGGKRVRAMLGQSCAETLGVSAADGALIGAVVELIHNASLVYDDLQDRDRVRRGSDAVWVRFGPDVALCTGALLLSAAYGALANLSRPERVAELVGLTHRRTAHLIHGQTADLSSATAAAVTPADYEQVATDKSGVLFALPLELACHYAGHAELAQPARRAANQFAIGYQIADDIADLAVDAENCRLNYVGILSRMPGPSDPVTEARTRSVSALREASELARALPSGAGALLADLAEELAAKVQA
jgi:geranylgeranyl pyrophosphate synthase